MSILGWIIAIAGAFGIGIYASRAGWSKLKQGGAVILLWIICSTIFGGGSSNPYYQKGYEAGFEAGKIDERRGDAFASRTEQLNESRYKFFRKYDFDSEDEKNDALKKYVNGYLEGYKEGWGD